jgi:hypothetical protein
MVRTATVPPASVVEGAIVTEVTAGTVAGVMVTVAVSVTPLYFAVIVRGVDDATEALCTVTPADVAPGGTTMLAGAGNAELPPVSVTVTPLAGAAALSTTVSVADVPAATLPGEIETEVSAGSTTGATVTVVVFMAPL